MKRLIHNNMTVTEQFKVFSEFRDFTDQEWKNHATPSEYRNVNLKRDFIEERFGIRCKVLYTSDVRNEEGQLVEPRIVDEKKCLFYLIKNQ
jgi:hypothetical protein